MPDYKVLTIPFARDAVPDMVNDIPDDPSVLEPQLASFKQGFPYITTIPLVAGGIPPEGQDFNGILRDITEHVVHQNKGGMYKFEADIVAAGGYPSGAVLAANDGLSLWVSLVDANVEDFNTGTPTQWARIAFSGLDALLNGKVDKTSIVQVTGASTTNIMSQKAVTDALAGVDKFNGPISTIASDSTVNLTTGAPNTSQIAISGNNAINGFTVTADRVFVVKFTGACTLVNSGSLVTGTGADIVTAVGDSCIIRATGANTVEILCGNFLSEAAVGTRGQTWQDLTGSRSPVTVYTNTTGRPISLMIAFNTNADTTFSIGAVTYVVKADGSESTNLAIPNIPAGVTYSLGAGSPIYSWLELR